MDKNESYEIIIKNTDDRIVPKPEDNIYITRKNVANAMVEKDAPLVSVYVLAYNNLEKYTRTCVECILKYTTDVDYELILVDNGSNDGTFEYFKSINHPKKKIIKVTKNIGPMYGLYLGYMSCSSKYFTFITNDLYVTKNWLSNMIKCAESDEKIGIVNPACDQVSNLQSVDLKYTDFNDMQIKAAQHNISDPRKWEEKIRLITLGTLFKKQCCDVIGYIDYGFFHDFSDDDISFRARRAGYKVMVCKDTFISHVGKLTDKGEEVSDQSLIEGQKTFKDKYYGVDAWGDIKYETTMMQYVNVKEKFNKVPPKVLGINIACGEALLEAKNKLRSEGIFNAKLWAFSTDAKYWLDLKTICEGEVKVDRIDFLEESFEGQKFDYIIMGTPLNLYNDPNKVLSQAIKLLEEDGEIILKIKNTYDIKTLLSIIGANLNSLEENVKHINIDNFVKKLESKGYGIKNLGVETIHGYETLQGHIDKLNINFKTQNDYYKTVVENYVVNICKI